MTDERIAELLGWPRGRANRDSSLMHRIRIVVAEAQAEQDAQIERMRAALVAARNVLDEDRMVLLDAHTDQAGMVDADGAAAAAEYDAVLALIDAALGDG